MAKYVGFKIGKVHESHVISEYYCGSCGFPVTDHDSFCPECGGAFHECDVSNLENENKKLRELIDEVHEMLYTDRAGMFHKLILSELEDGMRELGIEV